MLVDFIREGAFSHSFRATKSRVGASYDKPTTAMAHEILNRGVGFLTQRHCDKNTTHSDFLLAQIVLFTLGIENAFVSLDSRTWLETSEKGRRD